MLKKKLIYLEVLASLLLYGCSPSVKQTQAAAEKTTIEVETTAEAKEPEIPYIEAADSFAGGSGTEEDPYQIATAEQLALMGKVNDDWSQEYNKAYYVLTADIQLNDVENYENWKETPPEYQWKPVGNSFKGSFDGDGHVISGMYVRSVKDWFGIGLFRELFTGSVSNVKIEKGYLYINDSNTYAGGVIGNIVGTVKVENCSVDMAVCSKVTNGTDCVGGIVGWCQSGAVITGCTFHGDISYQDGCGVFGGICGYASGSSIINCETTGSIDVGDGNGSVFMEVAGIVGSSNSNTKIDRCINRINISGKIEKLGGICGSQSIGDVMVLQREAETIHENGSAEIINCINYGNLQTHTEDDTVGGIIGNIHSSDSNVDNLKIENCENYGDIEGKTTTGGIIGAYYGSNLRLPESKRGTLYIEKCKNTGEIICDSDILGTGGILGFLSINAETEGVQIVDCINMGKLLMQKHGRLGGILGHVDYSQKSSENWRIENCVNTGVIQYQNGTEPFKADLKERVFEDCRTPEEKAAVIMGGSCMGGIIGEMYRGSVKNCLSSGEVLVNDDYKGFAGAICGQVFFTGDNSEEKCYISDCKYLNKYPFAAMVPLARENDQSVQNTEGISEEEAEVLLQRWGL